MNDIEFKLEILRDNETFEYESIIYSNCAFIKLIVDEIDLIRKTEDKKGVVVWNESNKTRNDSGDFLILTCVCGVADDAGFNLITVDRDDKTITWIFNDGTGVVWKFDKNDYDLRLSKLELELKTLTVRLEPTTVVFPERMSGK